MAFDAALRDALLQVFTGIAAFEHAETSRLARERYEAELSKEPQQDGAARAHASQASSRFLQDEAPGLPLQHAVELVTLARQRFGGVERLCEAVYAQCQEIVLFALTATEIDGHMCPAGRAGMLRGTRTEPAWFHASRREP